MRAVASRRIIPAASVEAEEKFDVAHGKRLGAEHVAEEEVAKLDWIEASERETPNAVQEPFAGSMIEAVRRKEKRTRAQGNQHDWPVGVHGHSANLLEIEPHHKAEQ